MAIKKKRDSPESTMTAFISYSHEDRKYGGQAKSVLAEVGIQAFLAHDDLHVSDEWRERIIQELKRCELFVPLLSVSFLASKWAPQEVGFIVSRPEVAIATISLDGTKPFGFISHVQCRKITNDAITRELLVEPLAHRIPRKILPGLIRAASNAGSFRSAEALMAPLAQYFPTFTADKAQALAEGSVRNGQIWSAALCRTEYLPQLLEHQAKNISPMTLRALKYQIANDRRYREKDSLWSFKPWEFPKHASHNTRHSQFQSCRLLMRLLPQRLRRRLRKGDGIVPHFRFESDELSL
jgi:TIR domain